MNTSSNSFVVITIVVLGAFFGAVFGFWTTLWMIVAALLAIALYRKYKGDKEIPETIINPSEDTKTEPSESSSVTA